MVSVLVVDDEKLIRDTLLHYVPWHSLGIGTVLEANDGKQALEMMQKTPPDIVVTDIKMPHMDGIALAQRVRECFPEIRFVFLSGHTDKEYLKEAIHLHVDAYIEKPIDLDEFGTLIQKLAEECVKRKQEQNLDSYFYKGDFAEKTRNNQVYTLSHGVLKNLEKVLKGPDQAAAVKEVRSFCAGIRACEGTPPAYVCNVYFQLSLQFQNAAQYHNAKVALQEIEHFSQQIIHSSRLDQLERESLRLVELLFAEIASRDLEPVTLVNQYIQKNFADSTVTIDKIAQDLKFNTSYLCERYKQHTNTTISNALTAVRIEEACKLLTASDMKLYEIAYRVGYSNGKYFSKVFQKETGLSPKDYRRLHHA